MVPLDESRTWAQIRPVLLSLGRLTCTPIGYAGQDSDFGPGTDKLVFKDAGRLNWMTWTSDSITAIRSYLFGGASNIELVGVRPYELTANDFIFLV